MNQDQRLKEIIARMEPKREDCSDEESYLEARDGFRARMDFLLRPPAEQEPLDLTNLPFDPALTAMDSSRLIEIKKELETIIETNDAAVAGKTANPEKPA